MRLKTPAFWYEQDTQAKRLIARSLYPFSLAYLGAHALHQAAIRPREPDIPVICIGNLVAGGSGKTPVALGLMDMIAEHGLAGSPCFLSRGYGGTLHGPAAVDPDRHTSRAVGDEPLLLARRGPAFISRDRLAGAQHAAAAGHDLILMDDGLQNPGIAKTRRIVVIDGHKAFGNGMALPAGPLRQRAEAGVRNADAFVILGDDRHGLADRLPEGRPVFRAHLAPSPGWTPDRDALYVAFAGIGHPAKFLRTAREQGLTVAGWHEFPDHHPFTPADIERLLSDARAKGARLLTTEKDAARLPRGFSGDVPFETLPVQASWHDPDAVRDFLAAIPRRRPVTTGGRQRA